MNKKETLEEFAERIAYDSTEENKGFPSIKMVIKGAEWQQQRMFELVEEYNQMLIDPNVHEDHKEKSFKEWFKQFKNK